MKSVINDFEYIFQYNSSPESTNILNNGSTNSINTVNPTLAHRMKTRFRRRGDTTTFDANGAPRLGTASMAGPSGGRPASWAAAAFGRGDNRKVQKLLRLRTFNYQFSRKLKIFYSK